MNMLSTSRSYPLRTFISFLLATTVVVAIALIGSLVLVYRIPQINRDSTEAVQLAAQEKSQLLKFVLSSLESQLRPMESLAEYAPPNAVARSLQTLVGQGEQFIAVYIVSSDGIIQSDSIASSNLTGSSRAVGADLSRNPLFRAAHDGKVLWSDKYLSVVSGEVVIGVALSRGRWTVIGEIAPQYLRNSVISVAGGGGDRVLVVDSSGECIADSYNIFSTSDNLGASPIVQAALSGGETGKQLDLQTGSVFFASAKPEQLGWAFIVTRPAGMQNNDIRRAVILLFASFIGSLVIGLLLVPIWTRRLSRPIQGMIDRTHQFAEGNYTRTESSHGQIVELNTFGDDLQRMADAIRKREEGIVRGEERLRATLENTPSIAIQWYDSAGHVLYWNKASELLYGFTALEVIGVAIRQRPLMFVDKKHAEGFVEMLEHIDRTSIPVGPTELALRARNGQSVVVLTTTFEIPGDHGGKVFVCMGVDVTERKKAESALQDSEKRLEAIFNASPAPMSVADVRNDLKIINVNPAWERQFRRQRDDVVGFNGLEIGLWADPADRKTFFSLLENSGAIDEMEAVLLTKSGQRLLCSISAQITDIRGIRLLLMVTTDITERRRIEKEIKQLNTELEDRVTKRTEELSESNLELAAALDHLRRAQDELVRSEKLSSLGALVAGVAHELNTPLGNAVTVSSTLLDEQKRFAEMINGGISRSELNEFVSSVGEIGLVLDRNLHRAADLVSNFKQLAVDQSSYQRRTFDLQEIVHEITLAMGPSIRKTPYKVLNTVQQGLRLESYPGPLGQVLMNLINNAIVHAFNGRASGHVDIHAKAEETDWINLTVSDDGCGIPEEHQKKLFDPFFTTRLGQGGSGLGLHIVFNLVVDLLGGSITVSSTLGEGTAFHLRIPCTAPKTMQIEQTECVVTV